MVEKKADDVSEADKERIRQEEVDKMRKAGADQKTEANAAREAVAGGEQTDEAGGMHPGARPARMARPAGMQPETFPNEPGQGYRPNPANMKTELPPERQAPPAPEGHIGQGRVKPHEHAAVAAAAAPAAEEDAEPKAKFSLGGKASDK
jgi:hypothetical protein